MNELKDARASASACSSCAQKAGCSKKAGGGCASASSLFAAAEGGAQAEGQAAEKGAALEKVLSRIKYKLFIMSGKGGVGKSSVCVNLAAALARRGHKVGVLDVDLHGPSVPGLLGVANVSGLEYEDGGIVPLQRGNLSIVSLHSFLKDPDQAVLWRGPKKSSAIRQFLQDVHWGDLDFLLIDSPPGTGDEHMTILKVIPDVLCIVVTTPQEVALADVRKSLSFLRTSGARVLGLVENMSGLFCPHCGGQIDLFKKGGGAALAAAHELPLLAEIPLDPATVRAAEAGKTLLEMFDTDEIFEPGQMVETGKPLDAGEMLDAGQNLDTGKALDAGEMSGARKQPDAGAMAGSAPRPSACPACSAFVKLAEAVEQACFAGQYRVL